MFQIFVRAERHDLFGRVSPRLRKRIAVALGVEEVVHLLAGDFLLVERAQDQEGSAGVFEGSDGVQIVTERAGADDQRMGQTHAEVAGAEIHHFSLESEWTGSSSVVWM